ncbi:hypothetical protein [Chryseobacterium potabilaquae]|uniref:Uncharacterized protein n=1 Tax=Chryseobacterium potabilaquae TaxID=2675057 RepID=A0A6N4XEE1_9FLAO|nr:hypothetical protein [Chryseobacterium potabilaquae]CAA7197330.1 hypothetical protein CHRY9293_03385 [Chryseobacterium potabilaquae]
MRKALVSTFTIFATLIFGQKVSDYQYISIPENFPTFKADYGLREMLSKSLKSKKYIVLPSDKLEWPEEARNNSCNVVHANILNDSNFLRNKLLLQFKDCNDKVMLESKGNSSIKDFNEGFKDALQQTLASVSFSNPIEMTHLAETEEKKTSDNILEKPANIETSSFNNKVEGVQKFSNGKIDLQKIQIDNHQFILVEANGSSPFATFKSTTKNDVFRVKLRNGDITLGYYENGNIIIEIPGSNDQYNKEIFLKK